MSGFSITSNHYLRLIYTGNQDLATKNGRTNEKSSSRLVSADSSALRNGLKKLTDYKYGLIRETTKGVKEEYFGKLKAFSDAYNNTLESAGNSKNSSISKIASQIKQLSSSSSKELSDYGIKFDEKGYMSIKKSAVDNISLASFEDVLGKDSDYAKKLDKLSKELSKHIDLQV